MARKFIATLLLLALPALPAFAEKPEKHGKSKGHGRSHHDGSGGDHDEYRRFSAQDRGYWHEYWEDQYQHGHCPPGLAKKHNGCMPPGHAKKRYSIGYPLPRDVVILEVPVVLLPRLAPCPPGYRYGIIDGDLVQLAVGTLLVVDAIDGLLN